MEHQEAKRIIEAFLFVADEPVTFKMLQSAFDGEWKKEDLRSMLDAIQEDYASRGSAVELREIAGGWQLATKTEFAPWIRKLFKDRLSYRLSPSAMETLSIVAYKQPITRQEIEEIRGVDVSGVLDTLVDRRLLKIAGRKETLGRPLLFATTTDFLRSFGLNRLEDLPAIDWVAPIATDTPAPETPAVEAQVPQ